MARDKLTEYSSTAATNTVVGDVNVAENSALPSDMNNALREIMSHLADFAAGTEAVNAVAVDNLKLDGNTLSSTDTNGDINLTPNGTGDVTVTGTVAATAYTGDGSALTGISSVGGATGVSFNDSVKAQFGAGDDLQIYHDGSNSYIDDSGTGNFNIRSSRINLQKYTGETMAEFIADGATSLRHNNSKKLETTSTGVDILGDLTLYAEGSNNLRVDVRQGSAKAWMRYKSNSSTVTRDSFNVSSTSDLGSGRTRFSFSNNMGNTYYTVSGIGNFQTSGGFPNRAGIGTSTSGETAYTPTSSVRIDFATGNGTSNGSFLDTSTSAGTVHGDLA